MVTRGGQGLGTRAGDPSQDPGSPEEAPQQVISRSNSSEKPSPVLSFSSRASMNWGGGEGRMRLRARAEPSPPPTSRTL